jgi:hypothetical protein
MKVTTPGAVEPERISAAYDPEPVLSIIYPLSLFPEYLSYCRLHESGTSKIRIQG